MYIYIYTEYICDCMRMAESRNYEIMDPKLPKLIGSDQKE